MVCRLVQFSAKYEAEDAMARSGMQGEAKIICQQKSAAFEEWLKLKDDEYKAQRQTRIDMRRGLESDNESAYTLVEDVDEVPSQSVCIEINGGGSTASPSWRRRPSRSRRPTTSTPRSPRRTT